MWNVFRIFKSQPYLAGQVTLTGKKTENSSGIEFWLLKTVPIFNDNQDANGTYRFLEIFIFILILFVLHFFLFFVIIIAYVIL